MFVDPLTRDIYIISKRENPKASLPGRLSAIDKRHDDVGIDDDVSDGLHLA